MKKKNLRFRAIGNITYQEGKRTVKGPVIASSVSKAADHVASALEYWAEQDADQHGAPKSFRILLTPVQSHVKK